MPVNEFEVEHLTKRYRNAVVANSDISLAVRPGEIFGILGDNGAGKSTLIEQMCGLSQPSSGLVRFRGTPLTKSSNEVSHFIGYMPQSAHAMNSLTVKEALYYTAHLRGATRHDATLSSREALERHHLSGIENKPASQLSGGQARLLQLAIAMVGHPEVLVLDEPTNELDPENRRLVWRIVGEYSATGGTVVFITHDAIEAEKIIDRVAILGDGRLLACGAPDELKRGLPNRVRIQIRTGASALPQFPDVDVDIDDRTPDRIELSVDPARVAEVITALDFTEVGSVSLSTPSLEDLYLHYRNR